MSDFALGMIETKGLIGAIEAADAGLKAANVRLVSREMVKGAIMNIKFVGDVAAVKAAVDAAAAAASRVGELLSSHVIPNPVKDLEPLIFNLPNLKNAGQENPSSVNIPVEDKSKRKINEPASLSENEEKLDEEHNISSEDSSEDEIGQLSIDYSTLSIDDAKYLNELQQQNVHALRKLARETDGLQIQGRQISIANKRKLIEEIIRARIGS